MNRKKLTQTDFYFVTDGRTDKNPCKAIWDAGQNIKLRWSTILPTYPLCNTQAARVRRATINEGVLMWTRRYPWRYTLKGASWGIVEQVCMEVEMRNGICRQVLQSGAALKAIARGESARSNRRCIVWDGLEVYTLSSNRQSVPFDQLTNGVSTQSTIEMMLFESWQETTCG